MQVLLPFFIAVEIARAEIPGNATVICSALGHDTHSDNRAADHGLTAHCCSICTALAAAQGFAPPAAPPLPVPNAISRTVLVTIDVAKTALLIPPAYQSRGPPSIA